MSVRPAKRARLLSDGSSSGSDSEDAGSPVIKVNEEYRKRFEHNKAREERQRLEEKYGKDGALEDSEDDSTSESEDDEGDLATMALDSEILRTLEAIKKKDPRIYDKQSSFYKPLEDVPVEMAAREGRKEKPIRLKDYHRRNLLDDAANGGLVEEKEEVAPRPMTYNEEQAKLKRDVLASIHNAAAEESDSASDNDNDFLTAKPSTDDILVPSTTTRNTKDRAAKSAPEIDPTTADADPEAFLTSFMTSRAWVPTGTSRFAAFESEDESDEDRADAFEEAYNLRFEDPARANEKLITHSRQAAEKYSVRRDAPTARARGREREKEAKDAVKSRRSEEKARLRRLRLEEAAEKLERFREAAGVESGKALGVEEWEKFLERDFEDEEWEGEMAKRFGEDYYASGAQDDEFDGERDVDEAVEDAPVVTGKKSKNTKLKKPKWDDDIDIADIVPDFDEEEERQKGHIILTEDEAEAEAVEDGDEGGIILPTSTSPSSSTTKKNAKADRNAAKRAARLDRAALESIIASKSSAEPAAPGPAPFRYRATSPTNFNLTPLDILMASDSQLNSFAGLKKLAAFRDDKKKSQDRKKLGKKARLREWRKETFGDERGVDGREGAWEEWLGKAREGVVDVVDVDEEEERGGFGRERRNRGENRRRDERKDEKTSAPAAVEAAAEIGEEKKKKRRKKRKVEDTGVTV